MSAKLSNEIKDPSSLKVQARTAPWNIYYYFSLALLPLACVLILGLLVFKQAIIRSVTSTMHPELVYAILGAFFMGVLYATLALGRYARELSLMNRWNETPIKQRRNLLLENKFNSYLLPVYHILLGIRPLSAGTHQSVLDQEMAAINLRLGERLSLPNFLSGALVGLGLVGTFIGLLGTLEDLGTLFAGLAQSGSGDVNPTDLFADMVRRLQDPMKGMGTAFIASLYGLLGSLVLGLQILVVGKVAHEIGTQMQALVRRNDAFLQIGGAVAVGEIASTVKIDTQTAFHILHAAQAAQSEQSKRWQELTDQMRQQQERGLEEAQLLRREILSVIEVSKTLVFAVRENIQADDRYRKSMPRTSYWQDAWVKVQAYLQRANTDQSLAELSRIHRMQGHTLADIASTLARIEQRLGNHLESQFTTKDKKLKAK